MALFVVNERQLEMTPVRHPSYFFFDSKESASCFARRTCAPEDIVLLERPADDSCRWTLTVRRVAVGGSLFIDQPGCTRHAAEPALARQRAA